MTPPLGGKRRERKRLKRCAHRRARTIHVPDKLAMRTQCPDCLAWAETVSYTRLNPLMSMSVVAHALPDRIARRTEDA